MRNKVGSYWQTGAFDEELEYTTIISLATKRVDTVHVSYSLSLEDILS